MHHFTDFIVVQCQYKHFCFILINMHITSKTNKKTMTPPLSGIKCPPLEVPYYCVLIDEH